MNQLSTLITQPMIMLNRCLNQPSNHHANLIQQIQCVFSLTYNNAVLGSCYFYVKKIVLLAKFLNFKLCAQILFKTLYLCLAVTRQHNIINFCPYLRGGSCNQAPFCLSTRGPIFVQREGTFARLHFLLGGLCPALSWLLWLTLLSSSTSSLEQGEHTIATDRLA